MKRAVTIWLVVACWAAAIAQTPRRATATAIVSGGFVVGVNVADGGYGYTSTPPVHIVGGGGSNALVTATVSNSVVTSITVNNPGIGYGTTPQVSVAPPVVPFAQMTASPATHVLWTGLPLYLPGTFYNAFFLMKNISGVWVNQNNMYGRGGSFYGSIDGTMAFDFDAAVRPGTYALGAFPIPIQAYATAQVTNGFVTSINITNYGLGYTVTPPVQIIGGGGTGAQAIASIMVHDAAFPYEVSSITVVNPGSGYTNPPSVLIGPPDATLLLTFPSSLTPEMRLDVGNMVTNLSYQLQASPDLVTWTNVGGPFWASNSAFASRFYATNSSKFYRLQYLP